MKDEDKKKLNHFNKVISLEDHKKVKHESAVTLPEAVQQIRKLITVMYDLADHIEKHEAEIQVLQSRLFKLTQANTPAGKDLTTCITCGSPTYNDYICDRCKEDI